MDWFPTVGSLITTAVLARIVADFRKKHTEKTARVTTTEAEIQSLEKETDRLKLEEQRAKGMWNAARAELDALERQRTELMNVIAEGKKGRSQRKTPRAKPL